MHGAIYGRVSVDEISGGQAKFKKHYYRGDDSHDGVAGYYCWLAKGYGNRLCPGGNLYIPINYVGHIVEKNGSCFWDVIGADDSNGYYCAPPNCPYFNICSGW